MKKLSLISSLMFAAAIVVPVAAAAGPHAITTEQIAAAVNVAGMKVSPDQVRLLTDVMATTRAPSLKVESIEQWGEHRMKVRIDCVNSDECLPFFVAVDWGAKESPAVANPADSPSILRVKTGPASFVVRAGSSAVLILEGDHIHIKLSVICLENGATGQTIRVSSLDHRLTYTALVSEGAILRGRL
jgi:hypothetical protein